LTPGVGWPGLIDVTGPEHPTSPPGLELARLHPYLRAQVPALPAERTPAASLITGGRSNLTYRVRLDGGTVVLRRPPLGHVLATAHDMTREYRIISALAPTAVPVPQAIALCTDETVIGAPFYLMSDVDGTVYRHRAQTDALGEEQRRRLAFDMIDTLAALHAVDPASVGLSDFGHPDGFLARQVRRWAGQLERSRSRDLPGIDELHDRLAAAVPAASAVGIVHGDYRLDNLIVAADGRIAAVLDWEMATLGDPLADLGLLLTYWDALHRPGNPVADGVGAEAGFPTGAELIGRYAEVSGTDVAALDWYVGLGCYKLAVICEGIHYRYTLGQTVGEGFERMGGMVAPLVEYGLTMTEGT
jgi:aminoglycoside phosphotransferase (APT) family kinase protein